MAFKKRLHLLLKWTLILFGTALLFALIAGILAYAGIFSLVGFALGSIFVGTASLSGASLVFANLDLSYGLGLVTNFIAMGAYALFNTVFGSSDNYQALDDLGNEDNLSSSYKQTRDFDLNELLKILEDLCNTFDASGKDFIVLFAGLLLRIEKQGELFNYPATTRDIQAATQVGSCDERIAKAAEICWVLLNEKYTQQIHTAKNAQEHLDKLHPIGASGSQPSPKDNTQTPSIPLDREIAKFILKEGKDPYQILSIQPNATSDEIKKAFSKGFTMSS